MPASHSTFTPFLEIFLLLINRRVDQIVHLRLVQNFWDSNSIAPFGSFYREQLLFLQKYLGKDCDTNTLALGLLAFSEISVIPVQFPETTILSLLFCLIPIIFSISRGQLISVLSGTESQASFKNYFCTTVSQNP